MPLIISRINTQPGISRINNTKRTSMCKTRSRYHPSPGKLACGHIERSTRRTITLHCAREKKKLPCCRDASRIRKDRPFFSAGERVFERKCIVPRCVRCTCGSYTRWKSNSWGLTGGLENIHFPRWNNCCQSSS